MSCDDGVDRDKKFHAKISNKTMHLYILRKRYSRCLTQITKGLGPTDINTYIHVIATLDYRYVLYAGDDVRALQALA